MTCSEQGLPDHAYTSNEHVLDHDLNGSYSREMHLNRFQLQLQEQQQWCQYNKVYEMRQRGMFMKPSSDVALGF